MKFVTTVHRNSHTKVRQRPDVQGERQGRYCGRQTYQLTAPKFQPQLSQKQTVGVTVTPSLIDCVMHSPAQFVELLLTHEIASDFMSSQLEVLSRGQLLPTCLFCSQ